MRLEPVLHESRELEHGLAATGLVRRGEFLRRSCEIRVDRDVLGGSRVACEFHQRLLGREVRRRVAQDACEDVRDLGVIDADECRRVQVDDQGVQLPMLVVDLDPCKNYVFETRVIVRTKARCLRTCL